MMFGMFFYQIFFWFFIVLIGISIWQTVSPQLNLSQFRLDHGKETHAILIIKERYAKGEITKEQFEQMKNDLI